MAPRAYKATANFPSLGKEAHQEVLVDAGGWAAAMGLAARRLKSLPALKRKQIKSCSIVLQLVDGGSGVTVVDPSQASLEIENTTTSDK